MNSPLGKYAQAVAATIAVAIIGSYLIAVLFGGVLQILTLNVDRLQVLALIAIGAVFGSAATVNGVKSPLDSAHSRIDRIQEATGIETHGSYPVVRDPEPVTRKPEA
jgi:hypothetical protein